MQDYYRQRAAESLGKRPEDVTSEERALAKEVCAVEFYSMSGKPPSPEVVASIDFEQAERMVAAYHICWDIGDLFPGQL